MLTAEWITFNKQDISFYTTIYQVIISLTSILSGWLINKYWKRYCESCSNINIAYMKIFMLTTFSLMIWIFCIFTPWLWYIPIICMAIFGISRIPACLCFNALLQISIEETGKNAHIFTIINGIKLIGLTSFSFFINVIRKYTEPKTFMWFITLTSIILGLSNILLLPKLMIPSMRNKDKVNKKT
jgi:hypothetical protein